MKLIGVALLSGMMTVVVAAIATRPQPLPDPVVSAVSAPKVSMRTAALDRCRAVTMPDTKCEKAWDAEHRRFFAGAAR